MKKLNLGCGFFPKDGFVNLDINSRYPADVIHDMEEFPWPFKDKEFDYIQMDHVLEHLTDIKTTMKELYRILNVKGKLVIRVPHFSRGFTHWDHKRGFDITFPIYFDKNTSGRFEDVEFIHLKTSLKWFAQPDLKRQYLTPLVFYIGYFLGLIFDCIGNMNHFFSTRILCYWIGGYDEIKFVFSRK
tara:strand:- start:138 stop:695 length:558 start_codon:yes stop_codon:yes gene_type:complete